MFEIGSFSEMQDSFSELSEFRKIKPEDGTTFKDSQDFWNDFFQNEILVDNEDVIDSEMGSIFKIVETENSQEVTENKTYYYDDNGKLYRVGNELKTNCEYELNGYKYQTDEMGRIRTAEGNLHLKDREGRLQIKDSIEDIGKGEQREGDDRGHLIGDQFDGSNGLENMIPQDANINRNDFKNFENDLAKEVKDGKTVYYKVEPVYEGDSRRPSVIVVSYSINGQESVRVFPN